MAPPAPEVRRYPQHVRRFAFGDYKPGSRADLLASLGPWDKTRASGAEPGRKPNPPSSCND
jgi:hypothetical protein